MANDLNINTAKVGKGVLIGLATTGFWGAIAGGVIGATKKSEEEKDNIRKQDAKEANIKFENASTSLQERPNDQITANNYISSAKDKAIADKMATKKKSNLTTWGAGLGVAAGIAVAVTTIAVTAATVATGGAILPLVPLAPLIISAFLPSVTTLGAYGYSKHKSNNFKSEANKIGEQAEQAAIKTVSSMSKTTPQQSIGHYKVPMQQQQNTTSIKTPQNLAQNIQNQQQNGKVGSAR